MTRQAGNQARRFERGKFAVSLVVHFLFACVSTKLCPKKGSPAGRWAGWWVGMGCGTPRCSLHPRGGRGPGPAGPVELRPVWCGWGGRSETRDWTYLAHPGGGQNPRGSAWAVGHRSFCLSGAWTLRKGASRLMGTPSRFSSGLGMSGSLRGSGCVPAL